jgi:DNA sulfur modification protein DndB
VIAEVLKTLGIAGLSMEDGIDTIMGNISMNIDDAPWANVIWNPETRTIESGKNRRALAVSLINYSLQLKSAPKVRELTKKYRDISGLKKAAPLPLIEWSGSVQEPEKESGTESEKESE